MNDHLQIVSFDSSTSDNSSHSTFRKRGRSISSHNQMNVDSRATHTQQYISIIITAFLICLSCFVSQLFFFWSCYWIQKMKIHPIKPSNEPVIHHYHLLCSDFSFTRLESSNVPCHLFDGRWYASGHPRHLNRPSLSMASVEEWRGGEEKRSGYRFKKKWTQSWREGNSRLKHTKSLPLHLHLHLHLSRI